MLNKLLFGEGLRLGEDTFEEIVKQPAARGRGPGQMKEKVTRAEAVSLAWAEVSADDLDDRFAALEKEKEIDRLLGELKSRKMLPA